MQVNFRNLETHADIIELWPSVPELARDVGFAYVNVWKWHSKKTIPPEWWVLVVEAARRRDLPVTYEILAATVCNRKYIEAPAIVDQAANQ